MGLRSSHKPYPTVIFFLDHGGFSCPRKSRTVPPHEIRNELKKYQQHVKQLTVRLNPNVLECRRMIGQIRRARE